MGFKRKISFITVLIVAIVSSVTVTTAKAESAVYIELYYEAQTFVYKDEYVEPSNHMVAQELFDRRINAPLKDKLELIGRKLKSGADYKSSVLTCFPLLAEVVSSAIKAINVEPKDSELRFNPFAKKAFTISKEKNGVMVNEDRLYMDIYFALLASSKINVKIPVVKPPASVTTQDNIALTNLRAKYSTDFSSSTAERKHNISLALSKLNGAVIASGDTFSFNDTVGKRTENNGFKEAKIIKNGKYVPGIGGGVCQASTTLYNAALLADLQIVAVCRHSLQSSYELPSFDAMVNSGSSDLKIQNAGSSPVFIKAYDRGGKAYVEIYGTKLPYTIKRKSEVTFTGELPVYQELLDDKLEYFEQGVQSGTRKTVSYSHPEVHSNGYLLYYDSNGRLIQTKHIRKDKYNAVCGVIAVAP